MDQAAYTAMWIDQSETWWRETGNSLHVWRALAYCLNADPPLPIPAWCLPYLAQTTRNIERLASGWDFQGDAPVDPDKALARVPHAMGLSRQGKKNAFIQMADHGHDDRHGLDADRGHNAVEAITKERNISPERARRRLAQTKRIARQG
ncbi:hypothetical protein [Rhodopila sp.]|uniref:hypothetical protein n=1 Tax=Rhodopila sp. TaxID=2480087 RepID=UPI003D12D5EC